MLLLTLSAIDDDCLFVFLSFVIVFFECVGFSHYSVLLCSYLGKSQVLVVPLDCGSYHSIVGRTTRLWVVTLDCGS